MIFKCGSKEILKGVSKDILSNSRTYQQKNYLGSFAFKVKTLSGFVFESGLLNLAMPHWTYFLISNTVLFYHFCEEGLTRQKQQQQQQQQLKKDSVSYLTTR